MRDSLARVTVNLTGATVVNSPAINLGHDNVATTVGSPLHRGYEAEVHLPQNPTGTSPSIQLWLQFQDRNGNWNGNSEGLLLLDTDNATTGYPKLVRQKFFTPPKTKAVRLQAVLANADNNYGSATFALTMGGRFDS